MNGQLGRYRIQEPLGTGGMGEVYKAYDPRLERHVAIKLLKETTPGKAGHDLLAEARSASALGHPNICTVYEVEFDGGRDFLVLELVEGRPLHELIPEGGLPPSRVLHLGRQIADALAHAHGRGIAHRDLKCANVMVTPDGRVKVLDFGLARRVSPAADDLETRTRELQSAAGTLEYMAPETLRDNDDSDAAGADVWALGIVLYEMAVGRRPFGGRSVFEVAGAILHAEPPALPAAVPQALARLVSECLVKAPSARLSSLAVRERLAGIEAAVTAPADPGRAGPGSRARGRVRRGRIRAIAVLPLENLSRDPQEEFFADGITEALISSLAKIGTLRVISRTSVMPYKGARKALPDIARELSVDAVLEGSVIRQGSRLRISTQLVHAASDTHIWAETYDRELADVLSLQDEVATKVATEIRVTLTPGERRRLASARRINPAAHEAYLKGRYHWSRRSEQDVTRSLGFFSQAVALEPGYALAHAGIADSYGVLGFQGHLPPAQAWPLARVAAERALGIEPQLAEAHATLGYVQHYYDWDLAAADRAFRQAIDLGPSYATGHHWYALHLADTGQHTAAIREMEVARRLDPLSLIIQVAFGSYVLMAARQYDRGVDMLRGALAMDPHFVPGLIYLGWALERQGQLEDAAAQLEEALRATGPTRDVLPPLARVYARLGRRQDALEMLDRLARLRELTYVSNYALSLVHEALGDVDQGLAWLERAVADRDTFVAMSRVDPRLDGLRSDPRFGALMTRLTPLQPEG